MLKYVSASILALSLLCPAMAFAPENRAGPQSRTGMQLSFAPLVKRTTDAVVNVYAERVVRRLYPFVGDPVCDRFFGQRMPDRSEEQSSLGSGVVVSSHGLVVSDNRVIREADDIKTALADGREFASEVILAD